MRTIRILVAAAIIVLVPVLTATAARATINGPCTATRDGRTASSTTATRHPSSIPRKGDLHWKGAISTGSGKRNIDGKVYLKLPPPFGQMVIANGSWDGPSSRYTNAGEYHYNLPAALIGPKFTILRAPRRAGHRRVHGCGRRADHGLEAQEPGADRVAGAHVLRDPQRRSRDAGEAAMKGHPIRGFFAGLLLGIVLDLDLALGGVVKLDSGDAHDRARSCRSSCASSSGCGRRSDAASKQPAGSSGRARRCRGPWRGPSRHRPKAAPRRHRRRGKRRRHR